MLPGATDIADDKGGYAVIAARLRDWIVHDRVQPGTALPKQSELATRFGVSGMTISRAMRELQDDGFVVAIRRAGSFVAQQPPHTHRYAFAFPMPEDTSRRNGFLQALARESAALAERRGLTIDCFYGLDGHTGRPSHRALVSDIERQRLAGILFATPPFLLRGTPILTAPGLPRAAVMSNLAEAAEIGVRAVCIDTTTFPHLALQRLHDRGRRRVAILASSKTMAFWSGALKRLAPQLGLQIEPYWLQGVNLDDPACARRCIHLLFNPNQTLRPDGLIVADDNLLKDASAGLLDAGVAVPGDLSVIAHANFPWPQQSRVPVEHLGVDATEVLTRLLDAVTSAASTRLAPIPLLFAEQFAANRAARLATV